MERLVHLAYPEADEAMRNMQAQDQFIDALPDEDMRLHICLNKPATLKDAFSVLSRLILGGVAPPYYATIPPISVSEAAAPPIRMMACKAIDCAIVTLT